MKSIAFRLASVALVAGAVSLVTPALARASELDCTAGCGLVTPVALPGVFAETGGNALFGTTKIGSTGTGVIDSFLRVQNDGTESGHNTGGNPVGDEKGGGFTTNLQMNEIPISVIGGVTYFEFLLDINQTSDSLIALNNVQICTSSTADLVSPDVIAGPDKGANTCPGGTPKYTMGTWNNGTDYILMDATFVGSGSGAGDLFMYVPTSAFAGVAATDYLYLFTQFGIANGPVNGRTVAPGDVLGSTNDGFEEWAVKTCSPNCGVYIDPHSSVPEPSSLLLLGAGVLGLAAAVRRRRSVTS